MGLKNKLIDKKREHGIKRNLYNQLLEDSPTPSGLKNKMSFYRKVFSVYLNSSN